VRAGVLGPAITAAERLEETGTLDRVTCSEAARRLYQSTSFQFTALQGSSPPTAIPVSANATALHADGAVPADDCRYDVTPGMAVL
jgi:hypothetical protein